MKHWNSLSCTYETRPPLFANSVLVSDCPCVGLLLSAEKAQKKDRAAPLWPKKKIVIDNNILLNYEFFVFTFSECTLTNLDWIQLSFSCFGSFILKCVLFDKGMVSDLCKGWFLSLSLISSYINKFLRMPWCMYNLAPDTVHKWAGNAE